MLKYSFMCMHLNLKTTRVQWCLRVHEYPSAGVLCELCLCWAWTIFARPGGSSETVRECPSLLQQLVWKHGRQCGNLPASASAILILFHRGRQVWKSYQVFQGTTCDKTENQSLLYCLFLPWKLCQTWFQRVNLLGQVSCPFQDSDTA